MSTAPPPFATIHTQLDRLNADVVRGALYGDRRLILAAAVRSRTPFRTAGELRGRWFGGAVQPESDGMSADRADALATAVAHGPVYVVLSYGVPLVWCAPDGPWRTNLSGTTDAQWTPTVHKHALLIAGVLADTGSGTP